MQADCSTDTQCELNKKSYVQAWDQQGRISNIEGHSRKFGALHGHFDSSLCLEHQDDEFDNFICSFDSQNHNNTIDREHIQHEHIVRFSGNQKFVPSLNEHANFGQLSIENAPDDTVVALFPQRGDIHSPARLWQEKEQVLFSFSTKHNDFLEKRYRYDDVFGGHKSRFILGLCRDGLFNRALDVLFCIDPPPPPLPYLLVLNECSKERACNQARKIYAHFNHYNTSFVDLITEFMILSIRNSFDVGKSSLSLPYLSVFAWSAMVSALVENGQIEESLKMFQRMLEDGAEPSSYIFVSMIKACSIIKNIQFGMLLHSATVMKDCAAHLMVGSTLISMYGKCTAIIEAEYIFNELCDPDIVSCNAILAALVDVGQGDRALFLYRQLHEEGMHPNHGTFVSVLQACCCLAEIEEAQLVQDRWLKLRSLEIGCALHSASRGKGFASDAFIANTLINMYGKSCAIVEAELVFITLPDPDIILWNSLLSMYIQNNQGKKALWVYKMIIEEEINVVALTYVFALQACDCISEDEQTIVIEGQAMKMDSLRLGKALHLDATIMGFTEDAYLGTALISMYSKCGAVAEADDVFVSLTDRDIVSWNALVSGYVEWGQSDKALQLFRQMQEENVGANSQTIVFALQACANLVEVEKTLIVKDKPLKVVVLEIGLALHALAIRKCIMNSFVCNTIVNMYGSCGAVLQAEHVFVTLLDPDVVSWNAMLSAYVQQGQGASALQLYHEMQEKGTAPNNLTLLFALQACGIVAEKETTVFINGSHKKLVSLEIGCALHKDATAKGFIFDVYIGNALLSMYGKCGDMFERDNLFKSFVQRDIVSWNAMLSMFVEQGKAEQAFLLYKQLEKELIICDDATLIFILQACGIMGCLSVCEEVHFSIICAGYDQSPSVAATLLNAYGSCSMIQNLKVSFDGLVESDVVSWNAIICGHLADEDIASTLHLYEEMKQYGIEPDDVTLTSVLCACSHFGFVDGFECFLYTIRQYDIYPNRWHYGAVIDLFGRAGDFERVKILLEKMPWEPDVSIALCLLGSSRTHGNLDLAEWAFMHAVRLQPKQPSAYILMSNLYADVRI
ncbi:hypothetical protein KP509_20G054700 [Ceratopteris richardii]|nr:hypothetical protein KP509_20G054700 [Ceratopteris richardii]